jgi:hypothetical protein
MFFFCDNQQVSTGYTPIIAEKNNAGHFVKQNACLHLWAFGFSKCPIEFRLCKSISTNAQYVTLDNKIKCLQYSCFFFGNPTNKTVTVYWELLIANHLDQSL